MDVKFSVFLVHPAHKAFSFESGIVEIAQHGLVGGGVHGVGVVGTFPRMKLVGMAGYTTFTSYESGFGYIDGIVVLASGKDDDDQQQPAGKEKFYLGHNYFSATEIFRRISDKSTETLARGKGKYL